MRTTTNVHFNDTKRNKDLRVETDRQASGQYDPGDVIVIRIHGDNSALAACTLFLDVETRDMLLRALMGTKHEEIKAGTTKLVPA